MAAFPQRASPPCHIPAWPSLWLCILVQWKSFDTESYRTVPIYQRKTVAAHVSPGLDRSSPYCVASTTGCFSRISCFHIWWLKTLIRAILPCFKVQRWGQVWEHMSVIPALGRERHGNSSNSETVNSEDSLDSIASSRSEKSVWQDSVLKTR